MHELPVIKDILQIVLERAQVANATRVLTVSLEIGALSDLQDEWVERYFDHLSRDSIAEGATVSIARVPAAFQCNRCGTAFDVESVAGDDLNCLQCGSRAVTVVSGRAIAVKDMEVL